MRLQPDEIFGKDSPVTAANAKTRRSLPQSNGELMTEKQIFSFKPGPRLE